MLLLLVAIGVWAYLLRGFVSTGPDIEHTAPAGIPPMDVDFNRDALGAEGTGRDLVTYEFPLGAATLPISIEVEVLYQTVAPEFAEDLFQRDDLAPIASYKAMHEAADKAPTVAARVVRVIDEIPASGLSVR